MVGPRTEQFAFGALYKIVNLLQNMYFSELDGDPLVNDIIDKCWHKKYATIAEMVIYTRTLLPERTDVGESSAEAISSSSRRTIICRVIRRLWNNSDTGGRQCFVAMAR